VIAGFGKAIKSSVGQGYNNYDVKREGGKWVSPYEAQL
jgi:hypothetical protein